MHINMTVQPHRKTLQTRQREREINKDVECEVDKDAKEVHWENRSPASKFPVLVGVELVVVVCHELSIQFTVVCFALVCVAGLPVAIVGDQSFIRLGF